MTRKLGNRVRWLWLAISKRPNRIGVSLPSPEDVNRSSFRNVAFSSYLELRKMKKGHKSSDSDNFFFRMDDPTMWSSELLKWQERLRIELKNSVALVRKRTMPTQHALFSYYVNRRIPTGQTASILHWHGFSLLKYSLRLDKTKWLSCLFIPLFGLREVIRNFELNEVLLL
jgi:hypothetical protein